ncbi:iojap-like protein [Aeromicrobium marinum DSM 15272]|uniref:Ribosomal silencing factor RsfS n=1 Tax=Aeromicrobium marinum DSM 15272 TaxID=585531 RepID=E2SB72_9ACTN|nr:ribosome silencing factor [Aeromicrobium marinum]EFQ83618.1 iojap-like protein [Aeromicrobium marinum DSM 15272]
MTASDRAVELTRAAAAAADDKSATGIVAFDVSEQIYITDVFVLCTTTSPTQARAVQDAVEERLHTMGAKAVRREGSREGRWILLDFADIVVHVQHTEERAFYALERLWSDCPTVPVA